MKKNRILIGLVFFVGLLFTGCEDEFLNVLPRGIVVAKTTSDFRGFLDAADNSRYAYSLSLGMSYIDLITDDVCLDSATWLAYTTTREHLRNLFVYESEMWTYFPANTSSANDNNWNNCYYISSLISSLLLEIQRADDNMDLQKQLIAEARVHRAYAYLLLVNLYAKQYNAETAAKDLGVPIVLTPTALPSLKRNSVQEVYDFILKELTESLEDLPDDVNQYKHRPTKTAVYAIMARIYLYMKNYENALKYADMSLAIHNSLYDYNTIYTTYPCASYLLGISRMEDEEMLLFKTTAKGQQSNTYMFITINRLNELYPDYTVDTDGVYTNYDLRRALKFNAIGTNGMISAALQKSNKITYIFNSNTYRYRKENSTANSLSVATPEMYLTRAECNARIGNLQEALNDVNAIRIKRYATIEYADLTLDEFNFDQQQVIDRVLLERRRELYGNELRLFDIKRLGISFNHTLGSKTINVPAGDPRLIWQIYPPYIELNPELQQNDRTETGVTIN